LTLGNQGAELLKIDYGLKVSYVALAVIKRNDSTGGISVWVCENSNRHNAGNGGAGARQRKKDNRRLM
jgi:hypothetical protein